MRYDLRSALRNLVVWCYQELARRIGSQRMARSLANLDYDVRREILVGFIFR